MWTDLRGFVSRSVNGGGGHSVLGLCEGSVNAISGVLQVIRRTVCDVNGKRDVTQSGQKQLLVTSSMSKWHWGGASVGKTLAAQV